VDNTYDTLSPLERLGAILARLRAPDGCQWDRAQTHASLAPYLIEETYEVIEAIEAADRDRLKEELGDLLMHVFFHAQISSESEGFSVNDIAETTSKKLVRRHPHVFGEKKDLKPQEVRDQWEKIKVDSKEKEAVLAGVPRSMPALLLAYRVGEKAGGVGFDWKEPREIFAKLKEELAEFETEFDADDRERMTDELGDLMFALVNLARKSGIDPETALRRTVNRFIVRFGHIEASLKKRGQSFSETSLEEMERLWQEAKK
jgi:tetrapyrrole methylase family protein/MazG family protein